MVKNLRAQIIDLSDLFGFDPFGIISLPGSNPEEGILGLFRNGLTIATAFLAVTWVCMALIISLRFIASAGKPEKVEEASKSFRNLFVGITLLFLFTIVILFIANFFSP
jgi:hypothetical protein